MTTLRKSLVAAAGIGLAIPAALAMADAMIVSGNNVGVGTDAPSGSVHIKRTGAETPSLVLETTGPTNPVKWEIKANATTGRLTFKDLNGTTTPFKFQPTAAENLFRVGILDDNTVDINGNLVISGNCSEADGACADHVFQPDYELLPLEEVASFIEQNRHLPKVPSASEMEANGVNLAMMSGRLLEKVEELTLYTLQQHETIRAQQQTIDLLGSRVEQLESTRR